MLQTKNCNIFPGSLEQASLQEIYRGNVLDELCPMCRDILYGYIGFSFVWLTETIMFVLESTVGVFIQTVQPKLEQERTRRRSNAAILILEQMISCKILLSVKDSETIVLIQVLFSFKLNS